MVSGSRRLRISPPKIFPSSKAVRSSLSQPGSYENCFAGILSMETLVSPSTCIAKGSNFEVRPKVRRFNRLPGLGRTGTPTSSSDELSACGAPGTSTGWLVTPRSCCPFSPPGPHGGGEAVGRNCGLLAHADSCPPLRNPLAETRAAPSARAGSPVACTRVMIALTSARCWSRTSRVSGSRFVGLRMGVSGKDFAKKRCA
mmetsp:Transcript_6175/g.12935  ORF Transcript_6175/g.12935 Transcript_6175/m.12935 type:complete len:200 (+) Transcript_6175:160-759(+)